MGLLGDPDGPLTLDVAVPSTWGTDCKLDQVYKQAKDDARGILAKAFENRDVRVVGEMLTSAVVVDEEAQR